MIAADRLPPRPAHRRIALGVTIVVLVRGVLVALYNTLGDVQEDGTAHFAHRLADEFTGGLTALPLIWLSVLAIARFPLVGGRWRRHLLPVLGTFLAYSPVHTLAMELSRWATYGPLGMTRDISPQALLLAIGHEMPNDLFHFALVVASVELWRFWWAASERERHAAELKRSLAESQLTALRLQLQPHFLFNALNTVSATMYDDPRAADAMLEELAELLRASLRTHRDDEVPLRDEVAIAERYVRLQGARFGDRLRVAFDVPEACQGVRVPVFVLQPLIENAVRHGSVERLGRGEVRVRARLTGAVLELEVWDDGEVPPPTAGGSGLGLRATKERLRLLYGDAATFEAGRAERGWRVRITLPARVAAA